MATIDKMLIKGIRSFSPNNQSVIEFYKPLTLIVGPNGAGKTTVIECLKQACTGELPPNARSGQTFIHDPKIAGETEVKAQIRLRFRSISGKPVVCVRSFQLTQKASKMEYKAIESILQTYNELNEKTALSYRCADLDRQVGMLMGVPKAILENVIFVHQDEANWPLAEAAVLKKKFDDIFSSTRYTKALEAIKKLKSEHTHDVKEFKLKLQNLQTLKDQAEKYRTSIEDDTTKITHLRNQIRELEAQIGASSKSAEEYNGKIRRVKALQDEMKVLDAQKTMLIRQRTNLWEVLRQNPLREEDDGEPTGESWGALRPCCCLLNVKWAQTEEELINEIQQFEGALRAFKLEIGKQESLLRDDRIELAARKTFYENKLKQQGKLQAEAEAHGQQKQQRDLSIQQISSKHLGGSVRADKLPLSDSVLNEFRRQADAKLLAFNKGLTELKDAHRRKEYEFSAKIDGATEQNTKANTDIKHKQQQLAEKERNLRQLEQDLDNSTFSEVDCREAVRTKRSKELECQRQVDEFEKTNYAALIDAKTRKISELQELETQLQYESSAMMAQAEAHVKLDVKRAEALKKEESYTTIMERAQGSAENLLGVTPSAQDFKSAVSRVLRRVLSQKQREKDQKETSLQTTRTQLSMAEYEIRALGKKVADLQATLQSNRITVEGSIGSLQDYFSRSLTSLDDPTAVQLLEEGKSVAEAQLQEYKDEVSMLSALQELSAGFTRKAREQHACPLCERSFADVSQVHEFCSKQEEKNRAMPRMMQDANNRIAMLERDVALFMDARPKWLQSEELQKEITLESEVLKDKEAKCDELRSTLDDLQGEVDMLSYELKECTKLAAEAENVDRLVKETDALERWVKDEEARLGAGAAASRTKEQVTTELDAAREQRVVEDRQRQDLQRKKDVAERRKLNVEAELRQAVQAIERLDASREKLENMKKLRVELQTQMRSLRDEIQQLTANLAPIEREKDSLTRQREQARSSAQKLEAEQEHQLRVLAMDLDQVKAIMSSVEEFERSGKKAQLEKISADIAASMQEQDKLEERIQKTQEALQAEEKKLSQQDSLKRCLDDTLSYVKMKKDIERISSEIEQKRNTIQQVGEVDDFTHKAQRHQREVDELRNEQNRNRGTLSAYESNLLKNQRELERAIRDLDKYYSALDKALLSYHSNKMVEINKIIHELWQQTYRGQDIESIAIRSDNDNAAQRSYNYRVVMKSGDAELDMRGRCSAGQKVLACLIIRLALAETFCLNCGILALDEPTTNLDAANSESLAAALLNIMNARREQTNFQLIVITHDEKFAHMIGQREHAQHYWRVSKDDNQHSLIERQEIFD
eukprot:jgi/Chlat1/3874/Chrsp26S04017